MVTGNTLRTCCEMKSILHNALNSLRSSSPVSFQTRPMNLIKTSIPDVVLLEPKVFGDDRGFFYESWNARTFAGLGLDVPFVQDNHSKSQRGVLRGLHYQLKQPQGKLVRVVSGEVYD